MSSDTSRLVLVGTDGSATAEAAARRAADLADAIGARIHVVSAYPADAPVSLTDPSGPTESQVAAEAAERTADLLRPTVADVTWAAELGSPAEVLVREAGARGAEIIVVGNRRLQGLSRILGSVAAGVLHHAPCDVYVAHTA